MIQELTVTKKNEIIVIILQQSSHANISNIQVLYFLRIKKNMKYEYAMKRFKTTLIKLLVNTN